MVRLWLKKRSSVSSRNSAWSISRHRTFTDTGRSCGTLTLMCSDQYTPTDSNHRHVLYTCTHGVYYPHSMVFDPTPPSYGYARMRIYTCSSFILYMYKDFHMREERTKEVSKREGGGAKEGRTQTFQEDERMNARVCV